MVIRELDEQIRERLLHIFLTTPDERMFGDVLALVRERFESQYGFFGYINQAGDLVCPSMTRDIFEACEVSEKDITFPQSIWGGLFGRVLKERIALFKNGAHHTPEGHLPLFRSLGAPILYRGDLIGEIVLANRNSDYGENDKLKLELICNFIAPILSARLQRDQMERDLKKLNQDLSRQVDEKTQTLLETNARLQAEIGQRKRIESELRNQAAGLDAVLEQMPAILWTLDNNLKITKSIGSGLAGINLVPDALVGSNLVDYVSAHPNLESEGTVARHREVLGGSSFTYETEHQGRTLLTHLEPMRGHDGGIEGCIGVAVDITDAKRSEREAIEQNQILEVVAEGGDLKTVFDAIIRMIERRGEGVRASILLLDSAGSRLTLGAGPSLPEAYNAAIEGVEIGPSVGSCGTAAYKGTRVIVEDIATHPLWANFRELALAHGLRACWSEPIRAPNGKVLGTFAVYYSEPKSPSASEIQMLETAAHIAAIAIERGRGAGEIEALLGDLQRSNAELEQFASIVSHDLREPLRTSMLYLQLIARKFRDKIGKDADEDVNICLKAAHRMKRLIDGLLEYSRVGHRSGQFAEVQLGDLVENTLGDLEALIKETGAKTVCGPLPSVLGDSLQLSQLFQNLIKNAINYRGEAPPEIQISCDTVAGQRVFSVRDNGMGIDKCEFEKLFQPFQRIHQNTDTSSLGIGLAVCKRVVERHRGRIWVESEVGTGSQFLFTLG